MNKLFTKIAALALGMTMATGVGVAVASSGKEANPVHAATGSLTVNARDLGYTNTTYSSKTGVAVGSEGFKFSTTDVCKQSGTNVSNFQLKKTSGYLWNSVCPSGYTITSIQLTDKTGGAVTVKKGSSAKPSTTVTAGSNNTYTINDKYFGISNPVNAAYFTLVINYSSGATKLATPVPTFNDNTKKVTWSVEHASSYKVKIDSGDYATGTSPYDVSGLATGVSHTIYVQAIGDGTNYTDSDVGQLSFTPTAPAVYTSVTVTGGSVQGTDVGDAYIQCTATAQGTNIPASPSFNWYVTDTNTYATTTSIPKKASIDNTGKVTLFGNSTVYVWALAPDGTTHNTSGYAAVPGNLKGSQANPYSVSEAKAIADTLSSGQNNGFSVYCIGKVSAVGGSVSSKATSPVTFTVMDLTDNTKTLMAFSIQNGSSTDPSATNYVAVDYEVLIFGYLINFGGTKEIGFVSGDTDSSGFVYSHAPAAIDSIAVKTAPTKTAYKSGEEFVATGLVITATYTDQSTEDIAYADSPTSFSFNPTTITAAGNVEITYHEKTCYQAVTLITVTNVTSVASAPTEVYQGGSIDPDDVTLNVLYSDSSVGTVKATNVSCDTTAIATVTATATYSPATGTKTATFTVSVVKEPVYDLIVDELTLADTGVSGTTYTDWSGVTKLSGATYAGNTNQNNTTAIGMRHDTSKAASGIINTVSPGVATKIEIVWKTTTSRTLTVKGKNTAYSGIVHAFDGEEIGSATYSTTVINLSKEYKYIALFTDNSAGFDSIKITWKVEGASKPLEGNPELSTGSLANVVVGKNISLSITTNPVDSDEKLIVSSSNENYVTVSGSDRSYTIHGVAVGSATVTVAGAKGQYSSSVTVTVTQAIKTFEDKILTADALSLTNQYSTSNGTHSLDSVDFVTYQVCKTKGLQFQKTSGYLYNNEVLYGSNNIKSVTLIMHSDNTHTPKVYEGTSVGTDGADISTEVSVSGSFSLTGVNTFIFSSGMPYFKIEASGDGATNIDAVVVEIEDSASTSLTRARNAAQEILDNLSGLCGEGGTGVVSQSQWNTLNSDVTTALNNDEAAKSLLKEATRLAINNLSQGSAVIENAMYHYDACVEKFGFTPITDITSAQAGKISPINQILNSENVGATALIVIVSVVSLSAIGGYFFIRKRKEN